jgi:hypothetical protein
VNRHAKWMLLIGIAGLCAACGGSDTGGDADEKDENDPPAVVLGERLFLETRFAQAFFAVSGAAVNAPGANDPVMDVSVTLGAPLPGPFTGESMNCRACHLVDELGDALGGGVRTYGDFARRSPVPYRDEDAQTMTPRNSPPLVNATLPRSGGFFLHFDAEFASTPDLLRGTFTGRNFGWLPPEQRDAVAHLANVIRGDDGRGALARDFGGLPYRVVLAGTDPAIPPEFRLPPELRLDVESASDESIALFKTPGLRDLGQSAPYLHTGQKDTLEDVIRFYITTSNLARTGQLRNAAPELRAMVLTPGDVDALAAFLRALNEDYS